MKNIIILSIIFLSTNVCAADWQQDQQNNAQIQAEILQRQLLLNELQQIQPSIQQQQLQQYQQQNGNIPINGNLFRSNATVCNAGQIANGGC